tara:strand:+ start:343 stop:819 length:477 start_codon:yes stop_codon:yes gene_type:complete
MKNIHLNGLIIVLILFISSCGTKKIDKITGYQEVKTNMEARKYKDIEGEKYYVIVVGEHGDEGTAKRYAMSLASIEFSKKATTITEAAYKIATDNSLRDKVGGLDQDERNTAISKACVNNMILEEDKLFYNQETRVYKYRAVYYVSLENIVNSLLASN